MYCPRCGIETGDDKFCENCGGATVAGEEVAATSTTEQSNISYKIQKKIKNKEVSEKLPNLSIKKIISSIAIVVIIVGILIGYNIIKEQYTPRKTVEKYYNYLANKDYDNAYKMLINTDNNFLNTDIYKTSMQKVDFKQYSIKDYNSKDFQQNYDNNNPQNANFNNTGNMFEVQVENYLYPISVESMGKNLLFFNNYKINANNFTVKWELTAPKGAKVLIGGKEATKSNKANIDNIFDLNNVYKPSNSTYDIERIFNGSYDVTATMEGAKEASYKGVAAGKKMDIKFEPTQELAKQLQDKARSFLDLYYSNSSQDKYSDILTTDSNVLSSINQFSGYSSNKVNNKIKDIKIIKQTIDDVDHATISIKCTIDYVDSSMVDLGMDKQTGTKDVTTDFYFERVNGKWLICDTGYIN